MNAALGNVLGIFISPALITGKRKWGWKAECIVILCICSIRWWQQSIYPWYSWTSRLCQCAQEFGFDCTCTTGSRPIDPILVSQTSQVSSSQVALFHHQQLGTLVHGLVSVLWWCSKWCLLSNERCWYCCHCRCWFIHVLAWLCNMYLCCQSTMDQESTHARAQFSKEMAILLERYCGYHGK